MTWSRSRPATRAGRCGGRPSPRATSSSCAATRNGGRLAADRHLAFRAEDSAADVTATLFNRNSGLAEVVIPPRSALIGQTVFPGMVTPSGDLVVLAVQRNGEDQGPNETALAAGDSLLLQGTWKALDERLDDPDVLVVDSPELVRRQAVPLGPGAKQAIVVLLAMVALLITGLVPPGRRRPARRRRPDPAGRAHGRAVLPRDQLDDGHPDRRHDAALDRHVSERRRRHARANGSSAWSATPGPTRCSPGCSC